MKKFGVREICEVVLKAKAPQKVGNKIFYKGEPVCYFDTLKTSSVEGAATAVYAQGGAGNARLMSWEGERTVTFTMEDALISPEGFMILSGAGLTEATSNKTIKQHITETVDASKIEKTGESAEDVKYTIKLSHKPYFGFKEDGSKELSGENLAYVMFVKNGEIISEPYIPVHEIVNEVEDEITGEIYYPITVTKHSNYNDVENSSDYSIADLVESYEYDSVIVDYYTAKTSGAQQIDITPDQFGGNYYLEASTLFRNTDGVDMPAEFIIPNCKVQSNFTFTMASSGDPSTFTFTMDAFPDYTKFDHSKKVLAAIQIIEEGGAQDLYRTQTGHSRDDERNFN